MKVRNDWSLAEVQNLFALPFSDLLFAAQQVHRHFQRPNTVQVSTLLSIKTGACPEDCAYCPQSVRYDTGLDVNSLQVVADFSLDGVAAGENLAAKLKPKSDGVWELAVGTPLAELAKGKLTVSVKDRQGNISRIERTFSVGP